MFSPMTACFCFSEHAAVSSNETTSVTNNEQSPEQSSDNDHTSEVDSCTEPVDVPASSDSNDNNANVEQPVVNHSTSPDVNGEIATDLPVGPSDDVTSNVAPSGDAGAEPTELVRNWTLSDIKDQWRKFNIDLMPKVGCFLALKYFRAIAVRVL